jgi:hypothetical protein
MIIGILGFVIGNKQYRTRIISFSQQLLTTAGRSNDFHNALDGVLVKRTTTTTTTALVGLRRGPHSKFQKIKSLLWQKNVTVWCTVSFGVI